MQVHCWFCPLHCTFMATFLLVGYDAIVGRQKRDVRSRRSVGCNPCLSSGKIAIQPSWNLLTENHSLIELHAAEVDLGEGGANRNTYWNVWKILWIFTVRIPKEWGRYWRCLLTFRGGGEGKGTTPGQGGYPIQPRWGVSYLADGGG